MEEVKNEVFRDVEKTFNCNVYDCEFYGGKITINKPYQAFRCKFYKPRSVSASLTDCFHDCFGFPMSHVNCNLIYAAAGEVNISGSCGNNNIRTRVVSTSSSSNSPTSSARKYKKEKKIKFKPTHTFISPERRTSPERMFYLRDGNSETYCSSSAISLNGNKGIVFGKYVDLTKK